MASSSEGSPTITGWKRRSKAASFSILRYSANVVAPIQRSSPRARAGLIISPAPTAPSAAPAPTTVCTSSINTIVSGASRSSSRIDLTRCSNCPRNIAPATMPPIFRETMRLLRRVMGTLPSIIRRANPSTIAVLPTPGSPIRTGLFFWRRPSTVITRFSSRARPAAGSSFPAAASTVRSRPN